MESVGISLHQRWAALTALGTGEQSALYYALPIAYFDSLGLPRLLDGDA